MDYKKYSFEQLENWIHDALSCEDATPQEIYDVIKNLVSENYYHYKIHTERCYELLALLNGNGKGHIPAYDEYVDKKRSLKKSNSDFWEEHYYPEMEYQQAIDSGWEMTGDGFWIPPKKEDKVVKWRLPVEVDGASGEYYIQFPDDLMEAANIGENDLIEWIDCRDGSFMLVKVDEKSEQSKCG